MSFPKSAKILTGITVGVFALSAVGAAGSSAATAPTPKRGGTYTHAFSAVAPLQGLDPPTQIFHESLQVDRALVDSLVDQDPKTGAIVPWIAQSWTVSPDKRTFVFKLRTGGTFSDGTPIDAAAVKANFDRIKTLGPLATGAAPLVAGLKNTRVINSTTVGFDFDQPKPLFLQALSGAVLGLISPKDVGKSASDLQKGGFHGSGPFVLQSYNPQGETILTRRAGYNTPSSLAQHKGDAYIDTLRFVEVPSSSNRANSVQSGEIQSAALIAVQDEQRLRDAGVTLLPTKIPGLTENFIVNQQSFLGNEPNVRQALLHAIDSATIVKTLLGNSYGVAASPLGSTTPGFTNLSSKITYDPTLSKKLLDQAGWVVGGDGIRSKNGQKLTLRAPGFGIWPYAALIQQQLKAVGIDLPLDKSDSATQQAAIASGNYELYKWQMTRADPSVLNAVWNSTHTAQGYALAKPGPLDALLKAQETALDTTRRATASAKVQQYLIDNAWSIPLNDRAWTYAKNGTANGLRIDSEAKLNFYDVWLN